jgi:muramoyltetrapeptide carboxypeptidase
VLGQHILQDDHSYLSASDDKRRRDLQDAINDPDIRAILCARGGYGVTRIVDDIDFTNLTSSPKWIVGFSDITALLSATCNNGVLCVHGTMPVQFAKDSWTVSTENLRRTLFQGMDTLTADAHAGNRQGVGTGALVGGNLSIIADSLGTCSEIVTHGCILMLEEIDEDLYRVDRMLTHLRRTGKFDALAGLAIGHLSDLRDTSDYRDSVNNMLLDKIQGSSYPVGWGLPFGHENPNLAWVVGEQASLMVDERGTTIVANRKGI